MVINHDHPFRLLKPWAERPQAIESLEIENNRKVGRFLGNAQLKSIKVWNKSEIARRFVVTGDDMRLPELIQHLRQREGRAKCIAIGIHVGADEYCLCGEDLAL